MKLNQLSDNPKARKASRRVGRGPGSGRGKTTGRGDKGQKSRSGVSLKGFEGGQMPLFRRLPKRGFNNARFTVRYNIINIADLELRFETGAHVTSASLDDLGMIRHRNLGVKILGNGDITKKLTVEAARFSKTAAEKIGAAGGEAKVIASTRPN